MSQGVAFDCRQASAYCCPGVVPASGNSNTSSGAMMAKPKKPLTDRAIRHLQPAAKGKRRIAWDAIVPGLGVRVTEKGVKILFHAAWGSTAQSHLKQQELRQGIG